MAGVSVTSSAAVHRRSPYCRESSPSRSGWRSVAATRSPRASRCVVSSWPKPLDAPVMNHVLVATMDSLSWLASTAFVTVTVMLAWAAMKSTADPSPRSQGVRERTQAAIRRELAEAALRLFTERGFAETTAREIAAAVGVSERTFFRYFTSKEDVVLGVLDELGVALADRLAARPADEPPFVALRRSFDLMTETLTSDPEWSLAMLHLTHQVPALRGRQVEKQDLW